MKCRAPWLLALALVGLVGCKPAAKPEGSAPVPAPAAKSVLFISNANSPFWDAVDAGLKAGSQEFGVPARLERNSGGDAGQIRLLEQALTIKDQLIGVAVSALKPDADGILQAMKKLRDAGLVVVTVDSDCKGEFRDAFVGTNNLEAGKALGKKAAELKPEGATLCVFVGDPSSQNAKDRLEGFKAGAGAGFEVTEVYKDDVDPAKARTNVESALVAHPGATMLLGLWSYNGPAIAEVVENAGKAKAVTVVAFDAEPNLLPLIEQGKIAATLVQKPYEMGRQGVQLIKALAAKDEATRKTLLGDGDKVDTGMLVVTPGTYAEFKKDLDAKGLKSS